MRLLDRLRAETADLHAAVERDSGLVDDRLTLHAYGRILRRLHGFHAAIEPAVVAAVGDEAMVAPRRRLPDLSRDLAVLGLAAPARPRLAERLAPGDAAAGLGALYVLDGSRLGARVVARHLARHLGLGPETGARYVAVAHLQAIRFWTETLDRLAAVPSDRADAVVAGAATTFEAFRLLVCHANEGALRCSRIPAPT